jgi:hypothetical protein
MADAKAFSVVINMRDWRYRVLNSGISILDFARLADNAVNIRFIFD